MLPISMTAIAMTDVTMTLCFQFEERRNNEAKMRKVWQKLRKFVTHHRKPHTQTTFDGYQAL